MTMNFAEEVAIDAASNCPTWPHLHGLVFHWANLKKFDHRVSAAYRKRAAAVARAIWNAKGQK